jgi:hypothetical protein
MRRIVTTALQSTGTNVPPDGFFDRILKYIPADIVAGWVALDGLSGGLSVTVLWVLFAAIAILAYFWMLKQTHVPGQPPAIKQAIVATISFGVWAFALQSGPFDAMAYSSQLAAAVLIVYTLAIGLIVP